MLAELPDPDKLVAFCRNRKVMVTMAESVEKATRPQLQELVQLLVKSVEAKDRSVDRDSIEWTPPAKPFFGEVRSDGAPGRARGATRRTDELLVAYAREFGLTLRDVGCDRGSTQRRARPSRDGPQAAVAAR